MLVSLLLQTPTHTQTIIRESIPPTFYIPLAVTLFAALVAAWAAIKNTATITRTQNDVAELTNRTTHEIKAKDYKNDFYKKIIDKRLSAWEEAERAIGLVNSSVEDNDSKQKVYKYFLSEEEFNKVLHSFRSLTVRSFWMGKDYSNALADFQDKLISIASECFVADKENQTKAVDFSKIDDVKLYEAGIKQYANCRKLLRLLMRAQAQQLLTLHDIDAFFVQVSGIKAEVIDSPQH